MPFKVVLFFANGGNGWSETFYNSGSSADAVFARAQALAVRRKALLGDPTQIVGLRVSDEANPRVSTLTPGTPQASWPPYNSKADNPQTAAMQRLYGGTGGRTRALYLRGNPDDAYDLLDPNNPDAQAWSTAYALLGSFLSGQSGNIQDWLIKSRPRPVKNVNQVNIIDFGQTTGQPTEATITIAGAHGLDVGSLVTIYRIKNLVNPISTERVTNVPNAQSFRISYRVPNQYIYSGGGYYVIDTAEYTAITSYAANPRWTRRDTGRPSGASRGRRRAIRN